MFEDLHQRDAAARECTCVLPCVVCLGIAIVCKIAFIQNPSTRDLVKVAFALSMPQTLNFLPDRNSNLG